MAGKRSYGDGCPAATALEVVGERWALLVVRELLFGPRRFGDLQAGLGGISPNVLSQRLDELETAGVVLRRRLPAPASVWVYELSDWGLGLEPILAGLGLWAERGAQRRGPVSAAAVMLATKARAQSVDGGRFDLKVSLDGQPFHLRLRRTGLRIGPWEGGQTDGVLISTPAAFDRLLREVRDLAAAIRAGEVAWQGDTKAFRRLLELVPAGPGDQPSSVIA